MLKKILHLILRRHEARMGVEFDYAHFIVEESPSLFMRYSKIFSFLDPVKNVPKSVYQAARLTGALSADCGACVEAEIALAREAGLTDALIKNILTKNYDALPKSIAHVVKLSESVTHFKDAPESRAYLVSTFGQSGLIELSFAMNGAALLPGIKRALGYATACNLDVLKLQQATR